MMAVIAAWFALRMASGANVRRTAATLRRDRDAEPPLADDAFDATLMLKRPIEFAGRSIAPGERADLELPVSQSYSGASVALPMHVWRGRKRGPTLFVTAAVHGDEINGTGVVRELIQHPEFKLRAGTLVLVPVVNMFGFERQTRYLPDRRDLNRHFPGSATGSPASRFACTVFNEIVRKCDLGIDLHAAAVRRTNFPNVRADLSEPRVAELAQAFGAELIVDGKGPKGSLRRSACRAGCPAIILEAGEVWKVEPSVVEHGVRGVRNVLSAMNMIDEPRIEPAFQARARETTWLRADFGGMLRFHVAPGAIVEAGQALATNTDLLGRELNVLHAPKDGIVLGMTTLPTVAPGDPICHIAMPDGGIGPIREALRRTPQRSLHARLRDDLATNVTVRRRPKTSR